MNGKKIFVTTILLLLAMSHLMLKSHDGFRFKTKERI